MNGDELYRTKMEKRKLLQNASPYYTIGNGYRHGSEFWTQPETVGDQVTGLKMSITKTEMGYPVTYEHIRKPLAMKLETGIQSDDNIKRMIEQLKNDNKNNNYFQRRRNARTVGEPHSHWMESDYLKRRMKLMQHLMNDMDGCNPKVAQLELICGKDLIMPDISDGDDGHDEIAVAVNRESGQRMSELVENEHNIKEMNSHGGGRISEQNENENIFKERQSQDGGNIILNHAPFSVDSENPCDPLEAYPDHLPEYYEGPSIMFGDKLAKWNGSSTADQSHIGAEQRLTFHSAITCRDITRLTVLNNGTTAIQYEWNRIPTPPRFSDIRTDRIQRFYFNVGNGVILPGDVAVFPFTFKSPNAGIFSETWKFSTKPIVMGGASLHVILKGVSTEEEENYQLGLACEKIQAQLDQKEAEEIVSRMIFDLIRGIRTPERCPSPIDAHITEEELFVERNPGLHYNYQVVAELKQIYQQLYGEEEGITHEWNLSINDLRDCVHAIDDTDVREELLAGINHVIYSGLSHAIVLPPTGKNYNSTLAIFQNMFDEMTSCSMRLRSVMNMAEVNMSESLISVYNEYARLEQEALELAAAEEAAKAAKAAKASGKGSKKGNKSSEGKKSKQKQLDVAPSRPRSRNSNRSGPGQQQHSSNSNDSLAPETAGVASSLHSGADEMAWLNEGDDLNQLIYAKYKERFETHTRELLLEAIDQIFAFYEESDVLDVRSPEKCCYDIVTS